MNKQAALSEIASLEEKLKNLKRIVEEPINIMDRIKTAQDACDYLGWDINNLPKNETELTAIIFALNERWEPNWSDNNKKYYNWFDFTLGSGFAFCDSYYVFSYSYSGSGSRLVFKSEALAQYAAKQFLKQYNEWLQR
jgi:hypothetical protein